MTRHLDTPRTSPRDTPRTTRSGRRLRSRRLAGALATALAAGVFAAGCGSDTTTLTVRHGAVPAPVLIAQSEGASSVGDVRLWNFDGTTDDGDTVAINWIMTTTALDQPSPGLESRISTATFGFDNGDQLILEGVAVYPSDGAVLERSTVRAVVGGTGEWAGAEGSVESIHLEDDTWEHIFTLD